MLWKSSSRLNQLSPSSVYKVISSKKDRSWSTQDEFGINPNCEEFIRLRSDQNFHTTSRTQDSMSLHTDAVRLTGL